MGLLKSITAMLRGGAPGFAALEIEVLRQAGRQLDVERADKFWRRIESINLVQRIDGGREVNAYCMKHGKPAFDESLRMVDGDDEQKMADFSLLSSNDIALSGSIWLVNGQLFSVLFSNVTEHALDYPPKSLEVSVRI